MNHSLHLLYTCDVKVHQSNKCRDTKLFFQVTLRENQWIGKGQRHDKIYQKTVSE